MKHVLVVISLAVAACSSHLAQEVKAEAKVERTGEASGQTTTEQHQVTTAPVKKTKRRWTPVPPTPATPPGSAPSYVYEEEDTDLAPVKTNDLASVANVKSAERADYDLNESGTLDKSARPSFGFFSSIWAFVAGGVVLIGAVAFFLWKKRRAVLEGALHAVETAVLP